MRFWRSAWFQFHVLRAMAAFWETCWTLSIPLTRVVMGRDHTKPKTSSTERTAGIIGLTETFRATPTLVPSEETSVGQRFHGQHADARLHALGHHVGDEALVVGVGGVDRHLRGDHLHTPLFELLQHLEVGFVGLMAGEADVPDLALFLGLEKGVEHTVLDALFHIPRASEGMHLP